MAVARTDLTTAGNTFDEAVSRIEDKARETVGNRPWSWEDGVQAYVVPAGFWRAVGTIVVDLAAG